jgi:hypothetical protein
MFWPVLEMLKASQSGAVHDLDQACRVDWAGTVRTRASERQRLVGAV